MSSRARIYLQCIVGIGVFLFADGVVEFSCDNAQRFCAYLALALISATWKIKLPGITANFSTVFAFILIAIANLSLGEALVINCAATAVQSLWRSTRQRSGRKILFNVSAAAIALTVAYNPSHYFLSQGLRDAPWLLPLTAFVYFLVNTIVVAEMVALSEESSFRTIWKGVALFSVPCYVPGAVIAAAAVVMERFWGWESALVILPLLYVVYSTYRLFLVRRGFKEA